MPLVLDVQGFKVEKNKFVAKELAAYDGERICHYIFKPPFPFDMLPRQHQNEANWLIKNHHHINWNIGFTPLHTFNSIVEDLTKKVDTIYIKGKEKADYIRQFTSKPVFELEEQPRLQQCASKCFYHTQNVSMCALSNSKGMLLGNAIWYLTSSGRYLNTYPSSPNLSTFTRLYIQHGPQMVGVGINQYAKNNLKRLFSRHVDDLKRSLTRQVNDQISLEVKQVIDLKRSLTRQVNDQISLEVKQVIGTGISQTGSDIRATLIKRGGISYNEVPTLCNAVSSNRKRIDRPVINTLEPGVSKIVCAFKNRISSYRFTSPRSLIDYNDFFEKIKEKVFNVIRESIKEHTALKINFEAFGLYIIPEKELSDVKSFNTANKVITPSSDLQKIFEEFINEILAQASEFQEKNSGWTLKQIMFLDVNINKFNPIVASSYIKLPKAIENKKAVLNIQNNDMACFAWSVNAALFPSQGDPTATSSYPHYDTLLNFTNLEFPIKLKDIHRFEKMNNISINVFGVETEYKDGKYVTEVVGPLHFTKQRQPTHVNLLLVSDGEGNNHYCLISDLSRLVSSQKSKCHGKIYFCDGCLQSFSTINHLKQHEKNDCNHLCTKIPTTYPKLNKYGETVPENILKFVNFEKQLPVPFVIYADFECILKPIQGNEPLDDKPFTVKVAEHEPYSFGFYVKCNFNDQYSKFVSYIGANAGQVFIEKLDETVLDLYNTHMKHIKEMMLTDQETAEFQRATTCYICMKPFNEVDVKKEPLSVIAQNKEKYISFTKSILVEKSSEPKKPDKYLKLKFVDSFRFLPKSLDKLSQNLQSHQYIETRRHFQEDEQFNLIRQKGVFPYTYTDSMQKLEEKQLPSKEKFFNDLTNESLSDKDYERANKVWNTFKCETLGDYAYVYLKSDVLLLADVFENFRKVCLEQYKLDPAHYLTAPSLSWDAMLLYTRIDLELLTDIDMLHFFRKGIRGGVSQCSMRKAVANNKFLANYDPSKPDSYIMYLDATNLYGAAMKDYLPTGDFRWVNEQELENFNYLDVEDNSPKGYVLEVDLEYPQNLHDTHDQLPFCPEQFTPPNSKLPKLIPNLHDKTKYIIHYKNLKQCLKYGLKLKNIHRILEFSQSTWLGSYIDLNTRLRNAANNEFEKELFKLMVNSIFGKTMENVDKRQDIKLCSCWENKNKRLGARALIALPHFKSCSVFDEELVAVLMGKVKVVYDKPVYIGFTILDLSKTIIYEFLYGYIKSTYGDKATLLYTDTDSLILHIFTENPYNDIKNHIEYFDTSNYSEDTVHGMPKTTSVVGKMKDEYAGRPVECFYGTGAKSYCVKAGDVMKKAKGVSKSVIKHHMELNDYVRVVENGDTIFCKMFVITSALQTLYTELKNKVALSYKDDKRCVQPDGFSTYAWGNYKLEKNEKLEELLRIAERILEKDDEILPYLDYDFDLDLLEC
ncbi:hypothetical protein NQ315_008211 [Exocentrus adspersus]|uniref:C2H2-type domain-containing protein n=1 Tax=Exocentrus adspersus TaxID=1586481 RepID=A0AAV8VM39_9CUCU|nr:hypothetical protein NQ315_008211 [Exocentrus adspersus]